MSEGQRQPWPDSIRRLRLGDVEFDLHERTVTRDGRVHELNHRCFDLLVLFLREPHRLHTRDEIFNRVWSDTVVEDANLTTSIWLLRKALGDDAKGWIRTIAKQGYVFEPPFEPELEPVPPTEAVGPEPALPASQSRDDVQAPADAPADAPGEAAFLRRRKGIRIAIALGILAALIAVLFLLQSPRQQSRVIVLAVPDASLGTEARWPAELLQRWIGWQLDTRSDRISVADASGERDGVDTVVLISAAMPVGRDGDWRLRAHLHEEGRTKTLDRSSSSDGMLATIDALSRDVVLRFLPDIPAAELPSLSSLDAAAARELSAAIAAEQRGRWNEAAAAYRRLLGSAPDFGFAHLHLAMALAELGQSNAARAELVPAEIWVSRLPESMQPLLRARILAIRQDFLAAAAQFGELSRRSVEQRWDLRIDEATNLRRAGRARDALARLGGEAPAAPADALRWLIEKAECEIAMVRFGRAQKVAEEAVGLARELGWNHERARAELLAIDARNWSGTPVDEVSYDDAAAGFEQSGDKIGALRVTFIRQICALDSGADPAALDELLAEARAAGNAVVEIDALRRMGLCYLWRGNARGAAERLRQAEAIAEAAGDRYLQRLISANRLHVEMWSGDLTAVEQRVNSLRKPGAQGPAAYLVNLAQAKREFRRGEYESMLASLVEIENATRADATESASANAGDADIERAVVFTRLGRIADAKTIAGQWEKAPGLLAFRFRNTDAELAILVGDTDAAKSILLSTMEQGSKWRQGIYGWIIAAEIAPLLARVGESERARQLVDAMLTSVVGAGLVGLEIDLRIAAAEIALAQGRDADARRELAHARSLLQGGDWQASHRIRMIEIVLLRRDGNAAEASGLLREVHEEARARGDVLAELLIHSIAGADLDALCPRERQSQLVASTGMRGASRAWMLGPSSTAADGRKPEGTRR